MLEALLAEKESKTLEFKESANALHRLLQTIVAFANTAGGTLVIGVRDGSKEVVGVEGVLKQEERISSAIADSISPLLTVNFQFHTWRGRDVLIISVSYQPTPYFIKSLGLLKGTYVRLGSTNRVADKTMIEEIRRLAHHQSFDELPNLKATKEDLNLKLAKELFSDKNKQFTAHKTQAFDLVAKHQTKQYPTNGGLLLFCREPSRFFPNVVVRCGRFLGSTKTKILDQIEFDSPLTLVIEKIIAFIEMHTLQRSEIGRIERVDVPQYPPQVVREAVINAVVHADYSVKGSNIHIAIFDNRIEITNPGALPFGLSLEKALTGISQLRNRVIGQIFRELGLIERWGSGLTRMIEVCNDRGISPPKFEEQDNFFRVTLYHDTNHKMDFNNWQQLLVDYLRKEESINVQQSAELWSVTRRTASTRLSKLRQQGVVVEVSTGAHDPKKQYILVR